MYFAHCVSASYPSAKQVLQEPIAESHTAHHLNDKMTENTQKAIAYSAEEFNGNAVEPWNDDVDLAPVEKRLQELPGFGPAKPSTIKYVLHYLGHRDFSGAG